MAAITHEEPSKEEMLEEASTALDLATGFEVTTQATYELAAEEVRAAKTAIKVLTEKRMGLTRKFDELKKDVMSLFTPALTKWETVRDTYEGRMLTFVKQQELECRKEQERLEEEARKKRERLEAEAKKAAEEAAKIRAEAEAMAAKTKDAAKKEQLLAEAEVRAQEAQEAAQAAAMTAEVIVAAPSSIVAPVASGTSVRKTWKAKCDDKLALVKFVADHPEYLGLLDVNESALNQISRAQKENMRIAGCTSYEEQSITSRK